MQIFIQCDVKIYSCFFANFLIEKLDNPAAYEECFYDYENQIKFMNYFSG